MKMENGTMRIENKLGGVTSNIKFRGPGIISKGKSNPLLGPGMVTMDLGPGIIS